MDEIKIAVAKHPINFFICVLRLKIHNENILHGAEYQVKINLLLKFKKNKYLRRKKSKLQKLAVRGEQILNTWRCSL
jgi:hypothetical protein